MRAISKVGVAVMLGVMSAASANAAEPGFYVGGLYGDASASKFDIAPFASLASNIYDFFDFVPDSRAYSTEADGKSYGFFAGYRLTQHLAVEGGYSYFGKHSYHETAAGIYTGDPDDPAIEESWDVGLTRKTSGFTISALGILPISYLWEVYGRAGVLVASNKMSIYATFSGEVLRDEVSETSTDFLAGVGIAVSLAEVYALRAEFQRIFGAGGGDFGSTDLDVISVGVTVAF